MTDATEKSAIALNEGQAMTETEAQHDGRETLWREYAVSQGLKPYNLMSSHRLAFLAGYEARAGKNTRR